MHTQKNTLTSSHTWTNTFCPVQSHFGQFQTILSTEAERWCIKLSSIYSLISGYDPWLGFISIIQWFIPKASPWWEITGVKDEKGSQCGCIYGPVQTLLKLTLDLSPQCPKPLDRSVCSSMVQSTHLGATTSDLSTFRVSILCFSPYRDQMLYMQLSMKLFWLRLHLSQIWNIVFVNTNFKRNLHPVSFSCAYFTCSCVRLCVRFFSTLSFQWL